MVMPVQSAFNLSMLLCWTNLFTCNTWDQQGIPYYMYTYFSISCSLKAHSLLSCSSIILFLNSRFSMSFRAGRVDSLNNRNQKRESCLDKKFNAHFIVWSWMLLLTRNCALLRLKEVKTHPSPIGDEITEHIDLCSSESLLKSSITCIFHFSVELS